MTKPKLVYFIAALFVLSPAGNIAISLNGLGATNWYSPLRWVTTFANLSYSQQVWLTLNFLAGLTLFWPAKISWGFGIFAIAVSTAFNIINWSMPPQQSAFPLFALLSSASIGVILYHFRYPYLDRRNQWFNANRRYNLDRPFEIELFGKQLTATIRNISKSGALIELSESPFSSLPVNTTVVVKLAEILGADRQGAIARTTSNGFGLKFEHNFRRAELRKLLYAYA